MLNTTTKSQIDLVLQLKSTASLNSEALGNEVTLESLNWIKVRSEKTTSAVEQQ